MSQYTSRVVPAYTDPSGATDYDYISSGRRILNPRGPFMNRIFNRLPRLTQSQGLAVLKAGMNSVSWKPSAKPTTTARNFKPRSRYTTYNRRKRMAYNSRKPKSKIAKLSKRVSNIQKDMTSQRSELIYHDKTTGRVLAAVNATAHTQVSDINIADLEAVLAQLRFYNPSSPSTLVTADGGSGTYHRAFHFKSVYQCVTVYNNYQVPAKVTIYCVRPKEDTSITSTTAFTNGLADVGNPSATSPMIHLTDSPQFMDIWKIVSTKKALLQPSGSLTASLSNKDIYYSPATTDSETASYQARYGCFAIIVRVEGILGHDTSADEQGQLAAGIDWQVHTKYVVHYDAGIDLKYIISTDVSDTFTNAGVVSSKPVSDNVSYSVG